MASTWTTERLKQLVAWNGKVTAGSYAVVISEASLRSTEKLPSEGATGHDAGIKLGTVPAGTMVVVEDMSALECGYRASRSPQRAPSLNDGVDGMDILGHQTGATPPRQPAGHGIRQGQWQDAHVSIFKGGRRVHHREPGPAHDKTHSSLH